MDKRITGKAPAEGVSPAAGAEAVLTDLGEQEAEMEWENTVAIKAEDEPVVPLVRRKVYERPLGFTGSTIDGKKE